MVHICACVCVLLLFCYTFLFVAFTILKRIFSNRSMWLSGKIISVMLRIWYKFWYVSMVCFIFTYNLSCEYLCCLDYTIWNKIWGKHYAILRFQFGRGVYLQKNRVAESFCLIQKLIGWSIESIESINLERTYAMYACVDDTTNNTNSLTLKRIRA